MGEMVGMWEKDEIGLLVIGGRGIGRVYEKGMVGWDEEIEIGMKGEDYKGLVKVGGEEVDCGYLV